ncbi:MAG: hypothetical protein ACRDLS_07810 [Solirubrobacteraceae bacterium]
MPPAVSPSGERSAYGTDQAQLLRALQRGYGFPDGFAADKADAASRALRSKRARAVAGSWPALTGALGPQFAARFDAYARATSPPPCGGGLADGLVFVRGLARDELSGQVRVERLLARSRLTMRRGARARRGAFLGVTFLDRPRRLLIVLRTPAGAGGHLVVALGRRRR